MVVVEFGTKLMLFAVFLFFVCACVRAWVCVCVFLLVWVFLLGV